MRKKVVGVIGGHNCTKEVEQLAHKLGKKLAKVVDILVSGGLSGTMKAVCQGFKAENGLTIGIIPGYDKKDANPYMDIVIPSGLGLARNLLVVKSAEVVVALPGEAGTLSEIAYCLQFGIPVVSLKSWDIPGVIKVNTVDEAVEKVKQLLHHTPRRIMYPAVKDRRVRRLLRRSARHPGINECRVSHLLWDAPPPAGRVR